MVSLRVEFGLILGGTLVLAVFVVACGVLIAMHCKAREDIGDTVLTAGTRKSFLSSRRFEASVTNRDRPEPIVQNEEERKEESDLESQQIPSTNVYDLKQAKSADEYARSGSKQNGKPPSSVQRNLSWN